MTDKPDDRPKKEESGPSFEEPEIYLIISGKKFPRPGLETYFADTKPGSSGTCGCAPVVGMFCSCNKVRKCSCVPVCTCQAACGCVAHKCSCVDHQGCSCDSHQSGGTVTGCRCAPVH